MSQEPEKDSSNIEDSYILAEPMVQKLLKVLLYLKREKEIPNSGEKLLFEILHFHFYNISTQEIAVIMSAVSRKKGKYKISLKDYILKDLDGKMPNLFFENPHEDIIQVTKQLENHLLEIGYLSFFSLIENIIKEDGFLSYAKQSEQSLQLIEQLSIFKNYVGTIVEKYPDLNFEKWVEAIIQNADNVCLSIKDRNFEKTPKIASLEKTVVEELLGTFALSATALNNFLYCPLKFYYKNVIRVPAGKSDAMTFGSAVHFALEQFFKKMQTDKKDTFPAVSYLLDCFHTYMEKHRRYFSLENFLTRSGYGRTILTQYYNYYIEDWNKVVSIERNFNKITIDGIPLRGKVDKLEFDGNEVDIIDYKTGKVNSVSNVKRLSAPSKEVPLGGDYWRQAVFYKMLIENYKPKNWTVSQFEFDFIETNENGEYVKKQIDILPEDTEKVLAQIKDTWEKIQNHDFYSGCGRKDCYWCNFVRMYSLS